MNAQMLKLEDLTEELEQNAPKKVVVSIEYPYYISISSIEECDLSKTTGQVLRNELCFGESDAEDGYSWNDYYNASGFIEPSMDARAVAKKFWQQVAEQEVNPQW
jgi:hypothetical protein